MTITPFGLPNIINTCFLNACIQLIYSYDKLREEIVNSNSVYSKIFSDEDGFEKFPKQNCLRLISLYSKGNPSYSFGQYHDCNEFFTFFLDDIKTKDQVIEYDRSVCANESNNVTVYKCSENFLCVALLPTIHESVCDFMMERGDTHVFKNDFNKIGDCLIVSLKRFSVTFEDGIPTMNKDSREIEVNQEINMIENDLDVPMELVAFITHYGDYNSGHYSCHRKFNNVWYDVDDGEVREEDSPNFGMAYILLYKRMN